jgi:hypothetical protein
MWPSGLGQIQTSVQAGGTAMARMRVSSRWERIGRPLGPMYVKPRPARLRRMPGFSGST